LAVSRFWRLPCVERGRRLLDELEAVAAVLLFQSNVLGGTANTDAMGTFPLALIPLFAFRADFCQGGNRSASP
jgi:hypothetical protein